MKMKMILLFALGVLTLSAQTGTDSQINSANDNKATAVINQGDQYSGRQFIGALPGPSTAPGPFPGYPLNGSEWQLYVPAVYKTLSMDEVRSMKRGFNVGDVLPWKWGNKRVRSTVLTKNLVPKNDDPIAIVNWWPKTGSYPEDRVIGVVTVIGDWLWPEELYLGLGLEEAKKISNTDRVAIRARVIREGVTHGYSIGSGGAGALIRSSPDNGTVAAATGGVVGTNRVREEDRILFEILCLNRGRSEAPRREQPKTEAKVEPKPVEKPAAAEPKKEPENEWKEIAKWLMANQKPVATPPSPPTPVEAKASNGCETLPEFLVYFDFAKPAEPPASQGVDFKYWSKYVPDYGTKVDQIIQWINTHPACRVQVSAHTDTAGSYTYNAGLARRRAKAVYDMLIARDVKLKQFVSLSKDFPVSVTPSSDYNWQNRRVFLEIVGAASGK